MIEKNIDIIAVAILLCGIALYSGARRAMIFGIAPSRRIVVVNRFRPPTVVVPQVPRIPFTRD